MAERKVWRLGVTLVATAAMMMTAPAAAYAQPTNDDVTGATVITGLPYTTTVDTSEATFDPGDPGDCANNASVWWSFTPSADMTVEANTFGSGYDTVLSVYTGVPGSPTIVACNDDFNGLASRVTFGATAGTTYHLLVARCCGTGGGGGGGPLTLSVNEISAPANDDFADAATVGGLPYADPQNLDAATGEPGEPSSCFDTARTVWYSYTPTSTGTISATTAPNGSGIAIYTGGSLADLTQVACRSFGFDTPASVVAQAGTTYHFQVGNTTGPITFQLAEPADPTADFFFFPSQPSVYDEVSFFSNSFDPAGIGIASYAWDLGDGSTSTESSVVHRYAADGDYTVRLTVTTVDGRTGTTTRVVEVRTHDVAIVRINAPANAKVGQTIGINVYVRNTRYPEQVRVTLSRSVPGGFAEIGSSTQTVVVSTTGQTTRFSFNYTITSADKAVGKITFRADAALLTFNDALPGDNQLLSGPTKIS